MANISHVNQENAPKLEKAASTTKLRESQNKIKKTVTTQNTKIEDMDKYDSYLTDSEDDYKEKLNICFEESY